MGSERTLKRPSKRRSQGPAHARFDAFKLAERGESLSGEIDATALGRLADRIAEAPEGSSQALRWTVEGGRDEKGRPRLNLNLDGTVFVTCQRCLRPLEQAIEQDTQLLLARDESALIALDAEESEVVLAKAPLDALSLVEDELLLSLPFAPRHAEGECMAATALASPGAGAVTSRQRESPFAALTAIRTDKRASNRRRK
ncbi:MAG: YceD family protein [Betaproteobacteria bacterium]